MQISEGVIHPGQPLALHNFSGHTQPQSNNIATCNNNNIIIIRKIIVTVSFPVLWDVKLRNKESNNNKIYVVKKIKEHFSLKHKLN